MSRLILIAALVAVAYGRRSPNADYVEELAKAPGARFSDNIIEDALLDVPGLVEKYGYPIEVHSVVTADNYVLEMHRIPHGRGENNDNNIDKPVVYLMHGMMSSSAAYVVLGPGNALAYLLADAGYDVWLGNARGNYYSRNHLYLDPDGGKGNLDFWMFSFDEIGNYDLPALIDYVLDVTGKSKLHYIGFSQGGTVGLVLNSMRPEYNEKFISFQLMAPAAFHQYNENPFFLTVSPYEAVLESAAYRLGRGELFGNREFITWFATNMCIRPEVADFCHDLLMDDEDHYNKTMTPLFLGHAPASVSVRQFVHYAQNINSKLFRRYNHLPIGNIEAYGRPTPPNYDISQVSAPTYLHYGLADTQTHYLDILYLAEQLPNVVGIHQVERPSYTHYDFVWGVDAKEQLYDTLLSILGELEAAQKK